MEDKFGRTIDYLRISLTDRCNLRCFYCMPPEGIETRPREEILRLEEIIRVAEIALQLGMDRFRLTGGEPLLRKGIVTFVRALSQLSGIRGLTLTTNGILLLQLGGQLWDAGIRRLNISLDTLDPEKYRRITGGGDLRQVWRGVIEALKIGFSPVRINTVVLKDVNDDEWAALARLTVDYPLDVRFIELMPVGFGWETAGRHFASCHEVSDRIEEGIGRLVPAKETLGGGPAEYYQLPGGAGAGRSRAGRRGRDAACRLRSGAAVCRRCRRARSRHE